MRELTAPKLPKWPFYLGDLILLLSAAFICVQGTKPLTIWELSLATLCVAGAAISSALPFLLEYRTLVRLSETEALSSVMSQVQKIETIAANIQGATGRWNSVQEAADKTAAQAKAISEQMSTELKSFTEFMERANTSEKANLRLEIDKLRRAEADWLQVLVRILDHVYALHQGALHSGKPNIVEQMTRFQGACCEAARRVGLSPFIAAPSEPFNAERHQLLDGNGKAPADAIVEETIATGFSYQGQLVRPALVRLRNNGAKPLPATAEPLADQAPSQLPLEPSGQNPA